MKKMDGEWRNWKAVMSKKQKGHSNDFEFQFF